MADYVVQFSPEIWNDWVQEQTLDNFKLYGMSVVKFDSEVEFGDSSYTYNVKRIKAFGYLSDDVARTKADTAIAPEELQTHGITAPILRRHKAVQDNELSRDVSGIDMLLAFSAYVGSFNARQLQSSIGSLLTGWFGANGIGGTLAASHGYDHVATKTKPDTTYIDETALIGARRKFGDLAEDLKVLVVHSEIFNDMVEQGAIKYTNASEFTSKLIVTGQIPVFFGMAVVTIDAVCPAGTKNGYEAYPFYIMGGQPIYVGYKKTLDLEIIKNSLIVNKPHIMRWDTDYCITGPGMDWIHAVQATKELPNRSDLETTAAWNNVNSQPQHIGILQGWTTTKAEWDANVV